MTTSIISQRLAAKTTARQVEASLLADRAADEIDRVFAVHWRQFLRTLTMPILSQAHFSALRHLEAIRPLAVATIAKTLTRLARWGHRTARSNLASTLPTPYLSHLGRSRLGLLEAAPIFSPSVANYGGPKEPPGEIEIVLHALGLPTEPFDPLSFFFGPVEREPKKEPVKRPMATDRKRDVLMEYLFPAPPPEQIKRIVFEPTQGMTFEQRLANATRTSATPRQMAETVAQGLGQKKLPREIAKDLLPIVDGIRSTARRIARTEAMRTMNRIQHETSKGLDDLLIGYQIHAVLDTHSRPEHAARNGQVYYVNPKPGQLGLDAMPHPPQEADGSTAYNCRCVVSPVLRPPAHLPAEGFVTAEDKLITDPLSYSEWFSKSNEKRRRMVVGTRRYSAGVEIAGASPPWELFVDPEDGGLLPTDVLRNESAADRESRIAQVREKIAGRREALRRVYLGGAV